MIFQLAGPEHDAELRALLRVQPMPGWVQLAFEREPIFFHATETQGQFQQVIVAVRGGEIVGMGCRTVCEVYLNGEPTALGYLSGLRSRESVRSGTGLARGYAFLRQLHADGRAAGYITTIIEDNHEARRLLTSGRGGLPAYLNLGRVFTFTIGLGKWLPGRSAAQNVRVEQGSEAGLPEIVSFLNETGRQRQFFPVVRAEDFASSLWRDFEPRRFHVARDRQRRIAGVVGSWNQERFKQVRVAGYTPLLEHVRPGLNLVFRLAGCPPLPAPGKTLRLLNLCLACVRDDDLGVFAALLNQACTDARAAGFHHVCVALHERDPLCAAIRPWVSLRYTSRLYWVCWQDGRRAFDDLERQRIPHLEVATL